MEINTDRVLGWIGLSEGGYVNHPKDPGGATDRGITQKTYDAWNKSKGKPLKPVRGISKKEADDILFSEYLGPIRFNNLPSGIDYCLADFSVNSGPGRAVREAQRVVGVSMDGIMGNKTLAAIKDMDEEDFIKRYQAARLAFMKSLKTWGTFGKGWTTRVKDVETRALAMAREDDDVDTVVAKPTKAPEKADEAKKDIVKEVLKDPANLVPVAGALATPFVSGTGPVQYAVAIVIVLGVLFVAYRFLKRGQND